MKEEIVYYLRQLRYAVFFLIPVLIFALVVALLKDWSDIKTAAQDFIFFITHKWLIILFISFLVACLLYVMISAASIFFLRRIRKDNEQLREKSDIKSMRLTVNRQ